MSMPSETQYWATLDPEKLADKLEQRVSKHYAGSILSNDRNRIIKAYRRYYGYSSNADASTITASGERGELSLIYVNVIRYLVNHILTMIAGEDISYRCTPINTDVISKEQAQLCDAGLAWFSDALRLSAKAMTVVEQALVTSLGYIHIFWDYQSGDEYGVDELGQVIKTGELKAETGNVFDLFYDASDTSERPAWVVVRRLENRYDLAALYPEAADKIRLSEPANRITGLLDEDMVYTYTFYHERTPALPEGREFSYLDGKTVLNPGGPLSYPRIPVYILRPAIVAGTGLGYTPVFDMLGLSDAYNHTLSTILTNNMAAGVNNIVAPRGAGIVPYQLAGGLNYIEYDVAKPEVLQLGGNIPELPQNASMYLDLLMQIIGTNPTAMGQVETRLSGDAIALLDEKATQSVSVLQKIYREMLIEIGYAIFDIMKTRIATPINVELAGEADKYMLRSLTSESFGGIERVKIELDNPVNKSTAMKMEQAKLLLQFGLIKAPEQYYEAMSTGTIQQVLEGPRSEMFYIKEENEALGRGEEPPVVATDSHILHITEHKYCLASLEARNNPAVLQAALSHIQNHIDALRTVDPELLMILGQQPSMFNQQVQAQQRGTPDSGAAEQPNPDAPAQNAQQQG